MSKDTACLWGIARLHQWLPTSLNNITLKLGQHKDALYLIYEWTPGKRTPRSSNKILAGWEEMVIEADLPLPLRGEPFLTDALGLLAHCGRWASPFIFAKANSRRNRWKVESQISKLYELLRAHPWITCHGLPLMTWPADQSYWSDLGGNQLSCWLYDKDNSLCWQATALLGTEGKQDLNFLAIQAAKTHLTIKDNIRLRMTCHLAASLQRDALIIGKWEESALTHSRCKTLIGLLSCSHRVWNILHSHIQPYPAGKVKGLRSTFTTCKAWWNYAQTWEIRIRGLPEDPLASEHLNWRVLRAMGNDAIARTAIARMYADRILGERYWIGWAQLRIRLGREFIDEVWRELEQNHMEEVD
jgi:hypothetical protein